MSEPIVHVIDDETDVRSAIALLLRSVGLKSRLYASAQEFLEERLPEGPACLVVDVRLPGMSGLDLQARLARLGRSLPGIVITGPGDVQRAVRAMRAGALDFIEKPFHDQQLLDRVHEALARSARAQDDTDEVARVRGLHASLTEREREILGYVVDGRANKVIADDLGLSIRTVETHRARIMSKLGATSLSHLVRLAVAVMDEEDRASGPSSTAPRRPDS